MIHYLKQSGVFGDIIPQSLRQSNVYILKMESPDWEGHLVDIREGDVIPDQSVINVLQRKEAFTWVRHSQAHRLLLDRNMLRISCIDYFCMFGIVEYLLHYHSCL